jgi:hypothetical protein
MSSVMAIALGVECPSTPRQYTWSEETSPCPTLLTMSTEQRRDDASASTWWLDNDAVPDMADDMVMGCADEPHIMESAPSQCDGQFTSTGIAGAADHVPLRRGCDNWPLDFQFDLEVGESAAHHRSFQDLLHGAGSAAQSPERTENGHAEEQLRGLGSWCDSAPPRDGLDTADSSWASLIPGPMPSPPSESPLSTPGDLTPLSTSGPFCPCHEDGIVCVDVARRHAAKSMYMPVRLRCAHELTTPGSVQHAIESIMVDRRKQLGIEAECH